MTKDQFLELFIQSASSDELSEDKVNYIKQVGETLFNLNKAVVEQMNEQSFGDFKQLLTKTI